MTEEAHSNAHPTIGLYVRLAVILAVLTAVEVGLYYAEDTIGRGLARSLLVALAFLKFVAVIAYYMHLRYEKSMLSRFFTGGFILAGSLYGIVLGSFALTYALQP
jgi:cytochrome c oxidase subunit 4